MYGPMMHGHGCGCGPRGGRRQPRLEDEIAWLERHQRDLEQELADVVEKLRRLKKPAEQTPA